MSLGTGAITMRALNAMDESIPALNPAKLVPAVPGSWQAEIIGAGKQSARRALRVEFGNLTGYYILSTSSGETLVARWDAAASSGSERAIWLWDTPHYTMFVLEVNPALLQPKPLTRYSEDLLVWYNEPVWLESLELLYGNAAVGKEQIAGARS